MSRGGVSRRISKKGCPTYVWRFQADSASAAASPGGKRRAHEGYTSTSVKCESSHRPVSPCGLGARPGPRTGACQPSGKQKVGVAREGASRNFVDVMGGNSWRKAENATRKDKAEGRDSCEPRDERRLAPSPGPPARWAAYALSPLNRGAVPPRPFSGPKFKPNMTGRPASCPRCLRLRVPPHVGHSAFAGLKRIRRGGKVQKGSVYEDRRARTGFLILRRHSRVFWGLLLPSPTRSQEA